MEYRHFTFLAMIFCHIIDDYKLQPPLLNQLKQRSWWKDNAPDTLYRYDYLIALTMHSFSWTFMVMLPVAVYHGLSLDAPFLVLFAVNMLLHGFIDDLKANHKKINLITDQLLHIGQIIVTAFVLL